MIPFSPMTEDILRRAGWFPGRRKMITSWISDLQRLVSAPPLEVINFLEEFGGVGKSEYRNGIRTWIWIIDPMRCPSGIPQKRRLELVQLAMNHLSRPVWPIGVCGEAWGVLTIDADGAFYVVTDDETLYLLGANSREALHSIATGRPYMTAMHTIEDGDAHRRSALGSPERELGRRKSVSVVSCIRMLAVYCSDRWLPILWCLLVTVFSVGFGVSRLYWAIAVASVAIGALYLAATSRRWLPQLALRVRSTFSDDSRALGAAVAGLREASMRVDVDLLGRVIGASPIYRWHDDPESAECRLAIGTNGGAWKQLARIRSLRHLYLDRLPEYRDALEACLSHDRLRELSLSDTDLSDSEFTRWIAHRDWRWLDVSGTALTREILRSVPHTDAAQILVVDRKLQVTDMSPRLEESLRCTVVYR